ncbi:MAG: hypothetical protein R3C29_17750 [Dehalococcoidia bacterium]
MEIQAGAVPQPPRNHEMSNPLPPAKDYVVEIDARFLKSAEVPDNAYRVFVVLEHFLEKRDRRKKPGIGGSSLAAILGRDVTADLDRLQDLGVLAKFADEEWDSIGHMTVGGPEVQLALGRFEGPDRMKLDTRPLFCPNVSDRAVRLWVAVSLDALDDVVEAHAWTREDLKTAGDELAALGLATFTVGKDRVDVRAKKVPKEGVRVVEFTSEELGKVGGAKSNKSLEAMRKELDEKRRRDDSRGLR